MLTTIPSAKLLIPQPKARAIVRHALHQTLRAALAHPVTFVSAPAGSGKSTLVSAWLHHQRAPTGREACWLTLDADDNDLAHFLRAIAAALEPLEVRHGTPRGATLHALCQANPVTSPTLFVNILQPLLARLPEPLVLVIDDYHLIADDAIHAALLTFCHHLAPNLRLILISRSLPPPAWARLRAGGEMALLGIEKLRFSRDEIRRYFHQSIGLALDNAQLAHLAERTEGWIAGLQLAALTLQDCPIEARGDTILRFGGATRELFDYFVAEVLQRQPPATQHFLLHTAGLENLCGALCDAVTGQANGDATLAALARANAFITELTDDPVHTDGNPRRHGWYRYHPLWREALLVYAPQHQSAQQAQVYARAAAWHEAQGDVAQAVKYWQAAGDNHAIAHLIERHGNRMWTHADMVAICAWVAPLPVPLRQRHPYLLLFHAWALIMVGNRAQAQTTLEWAAANLDAQATPPPELRAIQHIITASLHLPIAPQSSLHHYALAADLLPAHVLNWRGAIDLGQGFAHLRLDDLTGAAHAFAAAIQSNRHAGNLYGAMYAAYFLGRTQLAQGALQQAQVTFAYARDFAERDAGPGRLLISWAYLGLAEVAIERMELDTARALVLPALEIGQQRENRETQARAHILLAHIHHVQGESRQALALLHTAELLARDAALDELLITVNLAQTHIHLVQRQWARVDALLARLPADQPPVVLMRARMLLARRDFTTAHRCLMLLRQPPPRDIHVRATLLLALIAQHQGDRTAARTYLDVVIVQGWEEGYRRLFLDEGAPLVDLLTDVGQGAGAPAALAELTAWLAHNLPPTDTARHTPGDGLSAGETAILQLVARGCSNQQIADARMVTVNTVKWHLKNIYAKLGVNRRTAAVARARANHWL